jgi:ATP-dependent Clp protease protease subunit
MDNDPTMFISCADGKLIRNDDPMFTRRGVDGKLVKAEELMPPAEILVNKRILQLDKAIAFTWETMEPRGLANVICEALITLDSMSHDPIKLIISSHGGSVHATFALYDTIKSIKSPVWTFGRFASSGGALILAAGEPGHRYIYPNTYTMLHYVQISGSGAVDDETNKIRAVQAEKERNRMIDLLIDCGVKRTAKQIRKDINKELYMDAKETVEYGLADEIITRGILLE